MRCPSGLAEAGADALQLFARIDRRRARRWIIFSFGPATGLIVPAEDSLPDDVHPHVAVPRDVLRARRPTVGAGDQKSPSDQCALNRAMIATLDDHSKNAL